MHDHTIGTALKKKYEDEKLISDETLVLLKSFPKDAERSIIRKFKINALDGCQSPQQTGTTLI